MKRLSCVYDYSDRVNRGSDWVAIPEGARLVKRFYGWPIDRGAYIGFRLCLGVR